ncbi:hypothetical protein ATPR_1972 [Acetobacter tropicalis NBRC 101654]|uniref:Uncharacterized protein n=1 Tax=Acetobacter tropicalis NBRC 101654 TaxID=749388 RepID=F7VF23_9PROT|nr:hypothetical protein ATPR_1972 [Acetobacter tropicalis NBRC 101654]
MKWADYADAFEWDASIRDIYIFETPLHDRQRGLVLPVIFS